MRKFGEHPKDGKDLHRVSEMLRAEREPPKRAVCLWCGGDPVDAAGDICAMCHGIGTVTEDFDEIKRKVSARIPSSVIPSTRVEIHPSEWLVLVAQVEHLEQLLEASQNDYRYWKQRAEQLERA